MQNNQFEGYLQEKLLKIIIGHLHKNVNSIRNKFDLHTGTDPKI